EDGARRATVNLVSRVASLGIEIDLVAIAGDDENPDFEYCRKILGIRNVFVIRRPGPAPNRFATFVSAASASLKHPLVPLTMRHFNTATVRSSLVKLLHGKPIPSSVERSVVDPQGSWQGIIYDGLHPAIHSSLFGTYHLAKGDLKIFY